MTGESLQENNSSVMDKSPDVQTNVWRQVIQDGPESAIIGSRRELRERSGKKNTLFTCWPDRDGENEWILLEDLVMRRISVVPTPSRETTTRRLHYGARLLLIFGSRKTAYPFRRVRIRESSQFCQSRGDAPFVLSALAGKQRLSAAGDRCNKLLRHSTDADGIPGRTHADLHLPIQQFGEVKKRGDVRSLVDTFRQTQYAIDNMLTKYQMIKFIDFCEVWFLPEIWLWPSLEDKEGQLAPTPRRCSAGCLKYRQCVLEECESDIQYRPIL
ncbi:hypothetical protein TNCV_3451731 [Trichonephila clavipes]|nr:hypothetical protein TNCV_3451731 [Trichonephila clavipes]